MANPINFPPLVEARQLVHQIQEEHECLSEQDLDEIGPPGSRVRKKVENAMLSKDNIIGSGVLTCVHPLSPSIALVSSSSNRR